MEIDGDIVMPTLTMDAQAEYDLLVSEIGDDKIVMAECIRQFHLRDIQSLREYGCHLRIRKIMTQDVGRARAYLNTVEDWGEDDGVRCCHNEDRGISGGCKSCGDPSF